MAQLIKNVLLMVASVAVAVALAEAGLRLAGVQYPSFYREDLYRGESLRPGARGWSRGEGGAWISVNSDGQRDREHSLAKPANTVRIAVLGDSFAEAMAVPEEKTFWSVLERRLSGCAALGGKNVEVLNFGVSGYGTAQELLTLQHVVWKYSPDIVLLAFFTGNDIRNNDAVLNQDPSVPYFHLAGGQLVLDKSYRNTLHLANLHGLKLRAWKAVDDIRARSRVLQVTTQARIALRQRMSAKAAAPNALQQGDMASIEQAAAQGKEPGLDDAVYAPPRDAEWRQAWEVTEALLVEIRNEVRAHRAQFWIATLSTGIQAHPDPAVRAAFMRRLGVKDLWYPDRRIADLGSREDIPVITLAPAFADYAAGHRTYLHGFTNARLGFGHWNEAGNRLGGELIAARLCRDAFSH